MFFWTNDMNRFWKISLSSHYIVPFNRTNENDVIFIYYIYNIGLLGFVKNLLPYNIRPVRHQLLPRCGSSITGHTRLGRSYERNREVFLPNRACTADPAWSPGWHAVYNNNIILLYFGTHGNSCFIKKKKHLRTTKPCSRFDVGLRQRCKLHIFK